MTYQPNPRWTVGNRRRNRAIIRDPYAETWRSGHLGPSFGGLGKAPKFGRMASESIDHWRRKWRAEHVHMDEGPTIDATQRERRRYARAGRVLYRRGYYGDPETGVSSPAMSGMGAANGGQFVIAAGGSVSPDFEAGKPGVYLVRMRIKNVPLSYPATAFLGVKPFNDAMKGSSKGTVTQVKYVGNGPVSDANWADSAIRDLFGGSGSENAVSDRLFDVTVRIDHAGQGSGQGIDDPYGLSGFGMGAVQIGAGAAVVILGAIALVLAATFDGFGKVLVESVKLVGRLAGAVVGGAAGAVAENAVPILMVVAVAAAGIWLLKKGGAKYTSKGGRFSF